MTVDEIYAIVERVMREMGCDPNKPPRWIPQMYKSMVRGYVCSICGKHSWSKKEKCDGCNSIMPKGE